MEFSGKSGIVTGGASGIGEAATLMLARRGASVLAVDVDEERLEKLRETDAAENIVPWMADVSDAEQVKGYVDAAIERFGKIDMFFNNAGVAGPFKPVHEITIEEWHQVIGIDLHGVFYGMKYVVGHMREQGGGSIVITGSNLSIFGAANRVDYAAAKHAILGIARTVCAEAGGDGVRVNVVCPGPVDTPLLSRVERYLNPDNPEEIRAAYAGITPMNRYATPDEIAETVCFLFSDRAPYISGIPLPIDGGFSAF